MCYNTHARGRLLLTAEQWHLCWERKEETATEERRRSTREDVEQRPHEQRHHGRYMVRLPLETLENSGKICPWNILRYS